MRTVLIVEDCDIVRRGLLRLGQTQRWHMLEAKDGIEALEVLDGSASYPDLILLDFSMPRMDGLALLRHLGGGSHRANLRVVLYTAITDPVVRQRAIDLGANDVVFKASLSWDELAAKLEGCMASPPGDPRVRRPAGEEPCSPFQ
jgi:CheY-like chemotaxis protein